MRTAALISLVLLIAGCTDHQTTSEQKNAEFQCGQGYCSRLVLVQPGHGPFRHQSCEPRSFSVQFYLQRPEPMDAFHAWYRMFGALLGAPGAEWHLQRRDGAPAMVSSGDWHLVLTGSDEESTWAVSRLRCG